MTDSPITEISEIEFTVTVVMLNYGDNTTQSIKKYTQYPTLINMTTQRFRKEPGTTV